MAGREHFLGKGTGRDDEPGSGAGARWARRQFMRDVATGELARLSSTLRRESVSFSAGPLLALPLEIIQVFWVDRLGPFLPLSRHSARQRWRFQSVRTNGKGTRDHIISRQ